MVALGPYPLDSIITGDARELAKAIPDESVDLIFTDPVYDRIDDYRWLAETAARVLKPHTGLIAFQSITNLPVTFAAIGDVLDYQWVIIWHRNNEMKFRYAPVGKTVYVPAVIYSKGKLSRPGFAFDLRSYPVWHGTDSNHPWSKPPEWIAYYLEALTTETAIVFDPFTGGGTVPAVCKMLRRHYLAFEIDPTTAELARQRVATTQAPLEFPEPIQEVMPL